jgi:predicted lipid-binding transport protein (Tim44 family)
MRGELMDFFIPLISTLGMLAFLIALFVGLFSAPWQVLIMILIGGLWMTEKLMQDNHRRSMTDENPVIGFPQFPNRR